MNISEIDVALTQHYRTFKAENGGKKTSADGKYGVKTLRYFVKEADATVHGPFLGRGKALNTFRTQIKAAQKPVLGVTFAVEEIFKPKAKGAEVEIRGVSAFTVTAKEAVTA
jgi:hypothetical protein